MKRCLLSAFFVSSNKVCEYGKAVSWVLVAASCANALCEAIENFLSAFMLNVQFDLNSSSVHVRAFA